MKKPVTHALLIDNQRDPWWRWSCNTERHNQLQIEDRFKRRFITKPERQYKKK